jgi:outer membrane protein assembly factor BamA
MWLVWVVFFFRDFANFVWYSTFLTRLCVFLARVFVPKKGGASCPGGDTLGGDLFYTATLAASVPFPAVAFLRDNGVRCFGFANVGTVSGGGLDDAGVGVVVPFLSILQSTRASVGGGVSMATAFGRLEATYATPLRYSPRDARKSVQIGLGFSFG